MADDTCSAETTSGGRCQNPATGDGDPSRCWIPTHNDADAENPDGRPSKFTDDRATDAIDAAREGKSKAGCARAAGVGKATLDRWLNKNPAVGGEEFRNAFRRARADGESEIIYAGLRDPDADSSMARFLLSTSFDYQESQEVELSGGEEIGGLSEKDKEILSEVFDREVQQ